MNNLLYIGWAVLVLYVLLDTDAIPKWAKLLRLKFCKYDEYEKKQNLFGNIKYTHFLISNYPNFLTYLFTCQECLGVWLTIGAFAGWSEHLHGWGFFGLTALGVLIGIALFKFILKKLYE